MNRQRPMVVLAMVLALSITPVHAAEDDTYDEGTVLDAATDFFGDTTEGLAKVVQKLFEDLGRPNASGAFVVGARYGKGRLERKTEDGREVFWQGPSIGFDVGGNASKVFVLVYHLPDTDTLFKRYPAVEGSFYFVAGVGANYHQSGDVVLAPIRTGVGLRAGVNVGYLNYTRKHSWIPL